jgi:hypothetical protein
LPAIVLTRTSLEEASGASSNLFAPNGEFADFEEEKPAPATPFSYFYLGPPHDQSIGFAAAPSSVLRI